MEFGRNARDPIDSEEGVSRDVSGLSGMEEASGTFRFKCPSNTLIAGSTQSGKTRFVRRVLENAGDMFDRKIDHILYYYGVYQPLFTEMSKSIPGIEFIRGLPTEKTLARFNDGKNRVIVLDDLMEEVVSSKTVLDLFTRYAHHRSLNVLFLTQNIFQQGKYARTISLNCHYLVLMKQRDESQIIRLGQQLYSGRRGFLLEAFRDATESSAYGYLLIDKHPRSPSRNTLRTDIFPGQYGIIYREKET